VSGPGTAPADWAFDAGTSFDSDGTVKDYRWDFGDGSTGAGAKTEHIYSKPGEYDVTLTVTDDQGATDSTVQQAVHVAAAPPASGGNGPPASGGGSPPASGGGSAPTPAAGGSGGAGGASPGSPGATLAAPGAPPAFTPPAPARLRPSFGRLSAPKTLSARTARRTGLVLTVGAVKGSRITATLRAGSPSGKTVAHATLNVRKNGSVRLVVRLSKSRVGALLRRHSRAKLVAVVTGSGGGLGTVRRQLTVVLRR
jgi:PKD repeat protein